MIAPSRRGDLERAWSCGLYLPGHDVHWIQAIHSGRDTENLSEPGRLIEVLSGGTLTIQVGAEVRKLWNHNPERLATLVARNDGEVTHQPHWGLLRTKSQDGAYCFCVVDADAPDRQTCPPEPPSGDPIDLIERAGGFSLPVREIERWLEDLERGHNEG